MAKAQMQLVQMKIADWDSFIAERVELMRLKSGVDEIATLHLRENDQVPRNSVLIGVNPLTVRTLESGLTVGEAYLLYHRDDWEAVHAKGAGDKNLKLIGFEQQERPVGDASPGT